MPIDNPIFYLTAVPAVLIAGVSKGGFGGGLGLLAVQAVSNSDYPILQGVILLTTFIFVFASLLVDVLYMAIDPRVRIQ